MLRLLWIVWLHISINTYGLLKFLTVVFFLNLQERYYKYYLDWNELNDKLNHPNEKLNTNILGLVSLCVFIITCLVIHVLYKEGIFS